MNESTKCPLCGQGTLRQATEEVSATVAGHTFTAALPALACTACDDGTVDGADLERFELRVAAALAEAGDLAGDAFKFARKALGLRAADLGELLGVAAETISRWETGARAPDRAAQAALATMVADRLDGRTTTTDRLRALATPRKLPKTVDLGTAA